MTRKVLKIIKLQCPTNKTNPSPPINPTLNQHNINIINFYKEFNTQTKNQKKMIIPIIITIYDNKNFSFVTKTPPTSDLLKKTLKIPKKSNKPNQKKIKKITHTQLIKITKIKKPDLYTIDKKRTVHTIAKTTHSMNINIIN